MKAICSAVLLAIMAAAGVGQIKKPQPPAVKAPFTESLQALLVTTKDWAAVTGSARLFERKNTRSDWKAVGDAFPVVVGTAGLVWGDYERSPSASIKYKTEGDGAAPAGLFPLTASFGSGSKPNGVEMPYTRLDGSTECVDDVRSSFYNRIVNRMQVGNFDWKSSEKMLAVGAKYELGVVVGYNSFPVEKGRGSCIFLHIWKDAESSTLGCTAMERRDLERIVAWASPQKNPYLIQLPESEYKHYRKAWKLPKK